MSKPFLSCIQNLHLLQMDEIWIKIILPSNVTELDTGEKRATSKLLELHDIIRISSFLLGSSCLQDLGNHFSMPLICGSTGETLKFL